MLEKNALAFYKFFDSSKKIGSTVSNIYQRQGVLQPMPHGTTFDENDLKSLRPFATGLVESQRENNNDNKRQNER